MKKRTAVLVALPAAVLIPAGTAAASMSGLFTADLKPVPHDRQADGGSKVKGDASLRLDGNRLTVRIKARGLTPNEPHAMHIHGTLQAKNECPGIAADTNTGDAIDPDGFKAGTPDGLISLGEGLPDYGPIQISLTTRGDTSAASGLELERFAKADDKGRLEYNRTFRIPAGAAKDLSNLHIVLHGTDLPKDGDKSSLSNLFEATLPVACGEIDRSKGGDDAHDHNDHDH
jgi:hypothetical protein